MQDGHQPDAERIEQLELVSLLLSRAMANMGALMVKYASVPEDDEHLKAAMTDVRAAVKFLAGAGGADG